MGAAGTGCLAIHSMPAGLGTRAIYSSRTTAWQWRSTGPVAAENANPCRAGTIHSRAARAHIGFAIDTGAAGIHARAIDTGGARAHVRLSLDTVAAGSRGFAKDSAA